MALPQTVTLVTAEEYLAQEVLAEYKHAYIDGVVIAMSGGSIQHSRIKTDLAMAIGRQLAGSDCEVFDSDLRVRVDARFYTYPDLIVVCGEAQLAPDGFDNLTNPTVLFEVLSPSTEAHDRGVKWSRYRQIPSLQQYVLVSQDKPLIEAYARSGDVWTYTDANGLDAAIELVAIGVTLALGDVYARVTFEEDRSTGLNGEPRG
jgi:Uma2 family endonuclease